MNEALLITSILVNVLSVLGYGFGIFKFAMAITNKLAILEERINNHIANEKGTVNHAR